jgi:hypothetical protein
MKPAALVAVVFLLLVACLHLVRVVLRVTVLAGGVAIPMWMSWVALLFTAGLALLLWRESRR